MFPILSGAIAMGHLAIALFMLRHWHTTRDRLFLAFGMAFGLLCIQRFLVSLPGATGDALPSQLLRLLAYLTILVAVFDKNRRGQAVPSTAAQFTGRRT